MKLSLLTVTTLFAAISIGHAADGKKKITSPAGYEASWDTPEEAFSVMTITKNGKLLSTVEGARPVSFSPDGTILLVREAEPDDDCRHYLLNLAAGEYEKQWIEGKELRIGSRFVVATEWSADGKFVTLKNADFIGGSYTVEVSKHCRSRIRVIPKDAQDSEASISVNGEHTFVDIKSKHGIGHATVELGGKSWPDTLTFRFHLGGLEGMKITQDGKELAQLKQVKAYLKDGTLFPEKYLLQKEGYYQVEVTDIPLTEHSLKIHWVNFYRQ